MNNFFLNQPDPLLHNGMYENIPNPILFQQMQQQQQFKDNVGELDEALKALTPSFVTIAPASPKAPRFLEG